MNLITSPIARLKSLLALHEKRVRVQSELDAIDQEISRHQSQLGAGLSSPAAKPATTATIAGKPGRRPRKQGTARGALKAQIFASLEKAGAAGVKVVPLAEALGTKSANIYAWFHAAVKRYKGVIKKIGGAHYRLAAAAPAGKARGSQAKTAKAPKPGKARKGGGTPRGALRDGIVATLQAAGRGGATVKEIASKLGANYKNIAVWFATTGRKNTAIKKIAPARYRIAR